MRYADIDITDYDTLLKAAAQQPEPQRFLFVFLKASLPEEHSEQEAENFHAGQGGGLEPIMCVDKTLDELSDFAALVKESEQIESDWQIVLIGIMSGKNGIMPTADEAEMPLKMMADKVGNGADLSQYLAFDRNGEPIYFS